MQQIGLETGCSSSNTFLNSTFKNPTIAQHFDALHQYVDDLGPGSSALVVNGWHARNLLTGDLLNHPDGTP